MSKITVLSLRVLEADIEAGLEAARRAYVKVGQAFLSIRDQELFKPDYVNWKIYCDQRWQINSSYADRLIAAYRLSLTLPPGVALPRNEGVARALRAVPETMQAYVWTQAIRTAPQNSPTAAWVQATAEVVKTASVTGGYVDDVDTGTMIALDAAVSVTANEIAAAARQKAMQDELKRLSRGQRTIIALNIDCEIVGAAVQEGRLTFKVYPDFARRILEAQGRHKGATFQLSFSYIEAAHDQQNEASTGNQ